MATDESDTECKAFLAAEDCESEIAVVTDAMTHVRCDVFCSSYWKKDVEF